MTQEIKSTQEYNEMMVAIFNLVNKGEANLSEKELQQLSAMSVTVERYEDEVLGLDATTKTPKVNK